MGMIQSIITVLSKDFCTSMNANYRKGGLVGLAATAIGLMSYSSNFLSLLLPPVLHCFDDPESRVRYYACESVYNIAKVSRQAVLDGYFGQIWEGLTKLFADVDVDVKNGANLLDRLMKDIVTEADNFHVELFLPLLQSYIRRTNPYIRQLIVGWITLLDSIPDISMLDYLPDFLDGLFNMLSDNNREIRQAADSALSEFLRELSKSTVVELGPIISILVAQCQSKERLNRLMAMTWLSELIGHPRGGDALLEFHAEMLQAIVACIFDGEKEIRVVAERTNDDMLRLVKGTRVKFELGRLLERLTQALLQKEDVPTKLACLRWINMLMEKRKRDMKDFTESLLPVLLRTLSDPSDAVVLLDLQALSRISLARRENGYTEASEEAQFQLVLNAILNLFAQDRQLLETRGSLIIRKLCVLLNAKSVYIRIADSLSSHGEPANGEPPDLSTLQFVSTMVQVLNLILLTASELHDLRSTLARSFVGESEDGRKVFVTLFHCWCHNPVATLSLCLLAQAYDLSFALVKRFSDSSDVSVSFLMQVDKLVHLLESPIFVHLRLQLLDVEAAHHAPLLKSIYGLLMCLPQGDAFRLLNDRLTTVCNLRDSLGYTAPEESDETVSVVEKTGLSIARLLVRFDTVVERYHQAGMHALRVDIETEQIRNSADDDKAVRVTVTRAGVPTKKVSPAKSGTSTSSGHSPTRRMRRVEVAPPQGAEGVTPTHSRHGAGEKRR
jgi:vacuole morphology and inheritance protein 14